MQQSYGSITLNNIKKHIQDQLIEAINKQGDGVEQGEVSLTLDFKCLKKEAFWTHGADTNEVQLHFIAIRDIKIEHRDEQLRSSGE